jgi:hypothetical protein
MSIICPIGETLFELIEVIYGTIRAEYVSSVKTLFYIAPKVVIYFPLSVLI